MSSACRSARSGAHSSGLYGSTSPPAKHQPASATALLCSNCQTHALTIQDSIFPSVRRIDFEACVWVGSGRREANDGRFEVVGRVHNPAQRKD